MTLFLTFEGFFPIPARRGDIQNVVERVHQLAFGNDVVLTRLEHLEIAVQDQVQQREQVLTVEHISNLVQLTECCTPSRFARVP